MFSSSRKDKKDTHYYDIVTILKKSRRGMVFSIPNKIQTQSGIIRLPSFSIKTN